YFGGADFANLDPQGNKLVPNYQTFGPGMVFSRLLNWKGTPTEGLLNGDKIVELDLAESYQQPDDTTVIFSLRKGVKYQNIAPVSGREWTADDVVYSLQRAQELKFTAAFLPAALQSFTAVDKYTVRITAKSPDADFINPLAESINHVDIPKETVSL